MSEVERLVAGWRERMVARGTFSPEDLDELELHLRSEIDLLGDQGLSAEEGFLVAARRLGEPEALGSEYAKVHPWATWRAPVYWMATGVLLFLCVQLCASFAGFAALNVGGLGGMSDAALSVLYVGLALGLPAGLVLGIWRLLRRRPVASIAGRRLTGVLLVAFALVLTVIPRLVWPITGYRASATVFPSSAVLTAMYLAWSGLLLGFLGALVFRLRRFAAAGGG